MALKKKKVGNYPNAMIIVSLTAALFLVGLCGLLVIQSKKLISVIKQQVEVRIMIDKDIDSTQTKILLKAIQSKPYVLVENNVPQVIFVSKDEAAKQYIDESKEDFKQFLGDNPLHDSYRVKLKEDYFEDVKLKQIKDELDKADGVFEVVYQEHLADQINKNFMKIYMVLATFALIMLVIIVLLMNNTIKLAIYSQRFLIRSMQLVGATNGFIQMPFLKKAAIQGLISGIVAAGLIFGILQLGLYLIEGLHILQENTKLAILLACVVVLGILIGVASTYQSLYRYLRMALDDLY
jgi:cell division transport system permease protein